jgi:hypothetical protein
MLSEVQNLPYRKSVIKKSILGLMADGKEVLALLFW